MHGSGKNRDDSPIRRCSNQVLVASYAYHRACLLVSQPHVEYHRCSRDDVCTMYLGVVSGLRSPSRKRQTTVLLFHCSALLCVWSVVVESPGFSCCESLRLAILHGRTVQCGKEERGDAPATRWLLAEVFREPTTSQTPLPVWANSSGLSHHFTLACSNTASSSTAVWRSTLLDGASACWCYSASCLQPSVSTSTSRDQRASVLSRSCQRKPWSQVQNPCPRLRPRSSPSSSPSLGPAAGFAVFSPRRSDPPRILETSSHSSRMVMY